MYQAVSAVSRLCQTGWRTDEEYDAMDKALRGNASFLDGTFGNNVVE